MAKWFPCCDGGGPTPADCIRCMSGTTPAQLQLTIPTIGDGTCDCSNIAGTYVLSQTEANACDYSGVFDIDMGACGTYTYTIYAYWRAWLGHETCTAFIHKNGDAYDSAQWYFDGSDLSPWDCNGSRIIPWNFSSTGPGPCDWDSVTGSVEWLAL